MFWWFRRRKTKIRLFKHPRTAPAGEQRAHNKRDIEERADEETAISTILGVVGWYESQLFDRALAGSGLG